MRGAVAYQQQGRLDQYIEAIFSPMWVTGKNMNEPTIVAEVLEPWDWGARIPCCHRSQDVKDKLKSNTEEAVERGAFGRRRSSLVTRCFSDRIGSTLSRLPWQRIEKADHSERSVDHANKR
ncbi:MAG: hypothetical protein CM1200mP41_18620 [Gammaproteobacteria bacterium]|nr:MAG: hypothetical protein CM1200mP41_18620 [Gammaproteobacteria bacterium]